MQDEPAPLCVLKERVIATDDSEYLLQPLYSTSQKNGQSLEMTQSILEIVRLSLRIDVSVSANTARFRTPQWVSR